ncbi:MAG: four helix bundle protein [Anaerolineales bacterium]|nr:four helix bundle protein [Anaerolineales bacterium]
MAGITRFEEIESWKTARDLTNKVYVFSNQDGFNRDFGLRDQIRRACISIMSNIAEGFESRTDAQFINFLGMARASAGEVRSQLYIALDQKYISQEQFDNAFQLAQTCSRQIANFIKYLEANPRPKRISDDSADYNV